MIVTLNGEVWNIVGSSVDDVFEADDGVAVVSDDTLRVIYVLSGNILARIIV